MHYMLKTNEQAIEALKMWAVQHKEISGEPHSRWINAADLMEYYLDVGAYVASPEIDRVAVFAVIHPWLRAMVAAEQVSLAA